MLVITFKVSRNESFPLTAIMHPALAALKAAWTSPALVRQMVVEIGNSSLVATLDARSLLPSNGTLSLKHRLSMTDANLAMSGPNLNDWLSRRVGAWIWDIASTAPRQLYICW